MKSVRETKGRKGKDVTLVTGVTISRIAPEHLKKGTAMGSGRRRSRGSMQSRHGPDWTRPSRPRTGKAATAYHPKYGGGSDWTRP